MKEESLVRLCNDIQHGWDAQRYLTMARQARIAKACQMLDKAHIEGVGQHTMKVDNFAFHSYGQEFGYSVWNDPDFIKKYKRDNPEVIIKHDRRKNKVGYGD
jgi:hypothetical protein